MKVVIDRFEGNYAVCEMEDRKLINIERGKVPEAAREGDILIIDNCKVIIDTSGTQKRKQEIDKLSEGLWE